jgi:hypothetical protein
VLAFSLLWFSPRAEAAKTDAYALKAAYLHRFVDYIQWPADIPTNRIIIGILDFEPYRSAIAAHQAETPNSDGPPVQFVAIATPADALACHVVFINTQDKDQLLTFLEALHHAPVLVVSDIKTGARAGAAISFFIADGKVRFSINQSAAERAQLTISSRLLRLGRIVNGISGEEEKP